MTNAFSSISFFCEEFSRVAIDPTQSDGTKTEFIRRNISTSSSEGGGHRLSVQDISILVESSEADIELIYQIFANNTSLFSEFIVGESAPNIKFDSFLKILDMDLANRYVPLRTAIYQFAFSSERFNWIQMKETDIDPNLMAELFKFENSHRTQNISELLDAFETTHPTAYRAWINDRISSSTSMQGQGSDVPNAKAAWAKAHQRVRNYAKKGTLCLDELQLIARDIGRGQVDIPHPGKFRTHPVRLSSGDFRDLPPPDTYLNELMANYESWLSNAISDCKNNRRSVILSATQACQRLISIHPFENGNGRVGRLVMDYIFESLGLFPPIIGENYIPAVFALKPKSKQQLNMVVLGVFNGIKQIYSLREMGKES